MNRRWGWWLTLLLIMNLACTAPQVKTGSIDHYASVSIMTFNVENLFDNQHDAQKDDYTYLPLSKKHNDQHRARCAKIPVEKWREQCLNWDWNDSVLEYKLAHLAQVIRQYNDGLGPDIIVFQEVENKAILERLRKVHLKPSNYGESVLIEGDDLRGIDVAFMSRLPVVGEPMLHEVDFTQITASQRDDTRGILQANFLLPDGQMLTGFAVHFPAPFYPYSLRIDSFKALNALLGSLPPGRLTFAAGDFNTPGAENDEHQIFNQLVEPFWHIAHQLKCRQCPGTYYYAPKDDWSFLDMILVGKSQHKKNTWNLDTNKTQLVNNHPQQRDSAGYPKGFDISGPSGISDHWPLLVELRKAAR